MKWRVNKYKTKIVVFFCTNSHESHLLKYTGEEKEKSSTDVLLHFNPNLESDKESKTSVTGYAVCFRFRSKRGKMWTLCILFASHRKKVCFFGYFACKRNSKKYEATQHEMKQNESSLHKSARHHSPSQPLSQNNLLFIIYRKDSLKRNGSGKLMRIKRKNPKHGNRNLENSSTTDFISLRFKEKS